MIDYSTHTTDGGTLVISIHGQLENQSSQYFFDCVTDLIVAGNKKIVINFADLGYISSVGLSALIRASSKAAKAGGTIFLARIENQLLDIFQVVKFDQIFNVYRTEHDAIAAIEARTTAPEKQLSL